ncbi:MAG: kinase [Cellvibrionales bacterium]|nr:kinase [Cellvibrionales bacterium]
MSISHHQHLQSEHNAALEAFITEQKLTLKYLKMAEKWFSPLISSILSQLETKQHKPLIVGINGCQGSGKSTLARYLRTVLDSRHHIGAEVLSLDDFYLSRQQRQHLAKTVHPLLFTRGVPGTHDIVQLINVIKTIANHQDQPIPLPSFNKALDDVDTSTHRMSRTDARVIIIEGWCLGATAQTKSELLKPINELERNEDQQGIWRNYVNAQLQGDYRTLFELIECWVMLKAPSFNCVFDWRQEQENKLFDAANETQNTNVMNDKQLRHFIAHYQRITESCLKYLPQKVEHLFEFNKQREFIQSCHPITSK